MGRYVYVLVRCVPDARTGEFVNVGAIAGDPRTGDWAIRQVSNESRVRKLAGVSELSAVHSFLARVGNQIDEQLSLAEAGYGETINEQWLQRLHYDHRNVVQLSQPVPIIAADAESALDIIFSRLVIDPVSQPRGFVTKKRVISDLREAYRRASIADQLVRPRVEIFVGDKVHTPVDYAIANGLAVQLTQAWSFQKASIADTSVEVKSWAYALRRLRDGDDARVIATDNKVRPVPKDVDIQVVVASPCTTEQRAVYEEASQVFENLGAAVHPLEEVDLVGERAAELLRVRKQFHSQD